MAEIDIEYLADADGSLLRWDRSAPEACGLLWCRGHVDPERFCRVVKEQASVLLQPVHVRHTYFRLVCLRVMECGPGRGAFPVTVAEVR